LNNHKEVIVLLDFRFQSKVPCVPTYSIHEGCDLLFQFFSLRFPEIEFFQQSKVK